MQIMYIMMIIQMLIVSNLYETKTHWTFSSNT